jgi:TRAP-type mannitol/chloroaromatic compound transport system permease small subunit
VVVREVVMGIMRFLVRKIDALNEAVGSIIQWAIVLLVGVFILESILRKVFSAPQIWFTETSYFIYGYYMMFGLAYNLLHGGHVSIDLFSERLPPTWRHLLAIVCYIVFTCVFALGMVKGGIPIAVTSWKAMEQGHSVWRPPLAHFRTVIPVAFFLLFLQGVSSIMKHLAALKGIKL